MPATRIPPALLVVWAAFLARGAFYAGFLPIWEGFDEWAHFAVVQRMAERGEPLVWRHAPISREIDESLKLAPVPWELRYLSPPAVTGDAYWRLPEAERVVRQQRFAAIPPSWAAEDASGTLTAYEALQPPVYYWLSAPLLRLSRGFGLGTRVLLLRWLAVAIASLAILLVFRIGRIVFESDSLAVGCAAVVSAMPEFLIDIARVGNECVGVVCWSLLIWLVVNSVRNGLTRGRAAAIGAVLGLGLLVKAYFLVALPPLAILLGWDLWSSRRKPRPALIRAAAVTLLPAAIAGWWYVRNLRQTGAMSGLSESELLSGRTTTAGLLARAGEIDWRAAVDSILFSHLWFGGWSSLQIRSWMYHLLYCLIAIAAVGLIANRRRPPILALFAIYASFWAGQLYNVLLLYATKGVATSMGWYLYAVIGAEAPLWMAGSLSIAPRRLRRHIPLIAVSLFVLLDLYTVHAVAVPYYSGLIAHRPNGSVANFHLSDFTTVGLVETFTRLAAFKTGVLGPWSLLGLWTAYLAGTGSLVAIAIRCGRRRERLDPRHPLATPSD